MAKSPGSTGVTEHTTDRLPGPTATGLDVTLTAAPLDCSMLQDGGLMGTVEARVTCEARPEDVVVLADREALITVV